NADASVRCNHSSLIQLLPKAGSKRSQDPKLELTLPIPRPAEQQRLERIPDRFNTARFRGPQHRPENHGKHVRMLVRIKMRNWDACRLHLANLCREFSFNLLFIESARNCKAGKFH